MLHLYQIEPKLSLYCTSFKITNYFYIFIYNILHLLREHIFTVYDDLLYTSTRVPNKTFYNIYDKFSTMFVLFSERTESHIFIIFFRTHRDM